jgi:hypothetical protein
MATKISDEPESIISFAIARSIRERPELAAVEMLKLIRANASLEAELFFLREQLLQLVRMGTAR